MGLIPFSMLDGSIDSDLMTALTKGEPVLAHVEWVPFPVKGLPDYTVPHFTLAQVGEDVPLTLASLRGETEPEPPEEPAPTDPSTPTDEEDENEEEPA